MQQRSGYKVQVREVPWWQPRYRVMRLDTYSDGPRWYEWRKFWRLKAVERWMAQGWWEDLDG